MRKALGYFRYFKAIAIKSSARRQTIAILLRKETQPAPCGHRLRWLTKTLAELQRRQLHPSLLRREGLVRMWSSPCRRDGEVEKIKFKLILLNQYLDKNPLKSILIWQGLYVLHFRYETIILLEITKKYIKREVAQQCGRYIITHNASCSSRQKVIPAKAQDAYYSRT